MTFEEAGPIYDARRSLEQRGGRGVETMTTEDGQHQTGQFQRNVTAVFVGIYLVSRARKVASRLPFIGPFEVYIELLAAMEGVALGQTDDQSGRSEERRVGKECRSRWSPYH